MYTKGDYLDINQLISLCGIEDDLVSEQGDINEDLGAENETDVFLDESLKSGSGQLNIFKYELFKMLMTRVLDEYDEESKLSNISIERTKSDIAFEISYNTLNKLGIIKNDNLWNKI